MRNAESIVRENLCKVIGHPLDEAHTLDLERNLAYEFGLTSLDKILMMTSVCSAASVPLTDLGEDDIAQLLTPRSIVDLINSKSNA